MTRHRSDVTADDNGGIWIDCLDCPWEFCLGVSPTVDAVALVWAGHLEEVEAS